MIFRKVPKCDEANCPLKNDPDNCVFRKKGKCYYTRSGGGREGPGMLPS